MTDRPEFDWPPTDPGKVVQFHVWGSTFEDGYVLRISGEDIWRRPIVGAEKGVPIVNVEDGSSLTAPNYLKRVFGDDLSMYVAKHSVYYPGDPSRPVGEAPTIRKAGHIETIP